MRRTVVSLAFLVCAVAACGEPSKESAVGSSAPSLPAILRSVDGSREVAPAPGWAPGTRFVFFSTNAVTQSDPGKMGMRRDPNGPIRDDKGGRWSLTKPVAGSTGGVGYTVIDVVAADASGLVLDQRLYFLPQGERGPSRYTTSNAIRTTNAGGDFFIHPALLAKVAPLDEDGITIIRERFERDGREVPAIRYTAHVAGYSTRVYDLASGTLLSETYVTQGSQGSFAGDDRYIREATVRTSGTHTFVRARSRSLPWLGGSIPDWVARTHRLVYRGVVESRGAGIPGGTAGVTSTYALRAAGPTWSIHDVSTVGDPQPGIPQIPVSATFATGTGSDGGLWIDPKRLAELEPGRIIDEDPILHARTSVSGRGPLPDGRATVTISSDSPIQRIDRLYDLASGRLLSSTTTEPIAGTNLTRVTRLDLASAE